MLLCRDPLKRPDCARVLEHPFLTQKDAIRLPGEKTEYDVFISYRVDSDQDHAEFLYRELSGLGLKVWWDKECLAVGVNWEVGFCQGLMRSNAMVCLVSRNAINKPTRGIAALTPLSNCDNVLLEWRLGLELQERGMITKIFPMMIGDRVIGAGDLVTYTNYFSSECKPTFQDDIVVNKIEEKCCEHLSNYGLGSPYVDRMGVKSLYEKILANQGRFLEGEQTKARKSVVHAIVKMCAHPHAIEHRILSIDMSHAEAQVTDFAEDEAV